MSDVKKVESLQIEEDMDFQKKEWRVERIGWVVMFLLILVALLGVFGVGPVSATKIGGEQDSFAVEYQRFGRFKSPTTLRILPNAGVIENNEVVFWIEDDYLKKYQIEDILPNPDTVEIGPDQYIYHFLLSPEGTPDEIVFYMQSQKIGPINGKIGSGQDSVYEISHFIFP